MGMNMKILLIGLLLFFVSFGVASCEKPNQLLKEVSEEIPAVDATGDNTPESAIELELFRELNAYRAKQGKTALTFVPEAASIVREHSRSQYNNRTLTHDGMDNRADAFSKVLGKRASGWAENVAMNYDHSGVTDAWIKSDGHRKNMLGDYTHVAIGVYIDPNGRTHYYTQLFLRVASGR